MCVVCEPLLRGHAGRKSDASLAHLVFIACATSTVRRRRTRYGSS